MDAPDICPACEKARALCVCDAIAPIDNRVAVLILRHPQEQDRLLGTARIATLQLKNCVLKTGLSWPNLAKAVGRPSNPEGADPKRWGVLYLGTAKTLSEAAATDAAPRPLTVIDKAGAPLPDQDAILADLEGVILLDGNWQQAKALWWRNSWMLKCRRLVLQPPRVSYYGNLRKEPRKESVSTIEAAAYTLAALAHDETLADRILPPFKRMLEKARAENRPAKIDRRRRGPKTGRRPA